MQTEIELRQMRYFLAVAEERSFTRAAKRCHVAQSSLWRQVRAVEVSLEAQLFERLPREVRLTQAGRIFEKEANKTLEHSRRAVSLVHALNREKEQKLRIGLSTLCNLPRIRTLVEAAQKASEPVAVECVTIYTPELLLALHRGRLDLAVVDLPLRSRGIAFHPILSEALIAVLPKSHPLVQRPMVRLFELKKEQIVMVSRQIDPGAVSTEAMLLKTGIEASSILPVASLIELLDHVPAHRSIGLMRSSAGRMKRDDVLYKPLADSIQLETAIAWRTENRSSQILSFRDAMIAFGQRSANG
ncbi:MAG: LysR family transcriptional regulator [Acidobacteria bacterium]|nr:LysR family transcriptional regulator [Acidobacteriota bacterium]